MKTHSSTFKCILLVVFGAGKTKKKKKKNLFILNVAACSHGLGPPSPPGYVAYFIAACVLDFQRATALVVLTVLAVVAKSYELLKEYKGKSISRCFRPAVKCFKSNLKWLKW